MSPYVATQPRPAVVVVLSYVGHVAVRYSLNLNTGLPEMTDSASVSAQNRENSVKDSGEDITFKNEDAVKRRVPWCSTRWTVGYIAAFLKCVLFIFNVNMAIALPFMVTSAGNHLTGTGSNETETDQNSTASLGGQGNQLPGLLWDKTHQCFVLSAYFFGYLVSQLPAGWAVDRFGSKHVVTGAVAISTVLTLVIPVAARASVHVAITIRVLLGLCAGATVPATYDIVSSWALPFERNKFISMLWFGQSLGIVVGYVTSGILCAYGFDDGWGSVFYINGVFGVVFLVVWLVCFTDSPEDHPRISGAERHLLSTNRPCLQLWTETSNVPCQRLLTSVSVWSVFVTHMFDSFTYYLVAVYMPLFLAEVMGMSVLTIGLVSALPFIFSGVGFGIAGSVADVLITKKGLPSTTTRKIFGIVGLCCGGVFVMVPGYLTCDQRPLVMFCFCCCLLFLGVSQGAGYTRNAGEIAPRYMEIIWILSSTLSAIPASITPFAVEELTQSGTVEEWRVVLDTAAVCALLAAVAYGMFSSCDLEWWARSRPGEPCQKVEDDRYLLVNGLFHPDEMWP